MFRIEISRYVRRGVGTYRPRLPNQYDLFTSAKLFLPQRQRQQTEAVVVAQLVEWLLPIPEVHGLNAVNSQFLIINILTINYFRGC